MMGMAGFVVTLMVIAAIISPCVYGKELYDHEEIKIQRLLKLLNKPALKSIKSEDGDIIDCVPITSQPAFDHPLLKNHTIQMKPSFIPKGSDEKAKAITQVWNKNGTCPENTVPIRRTTKEDILRAQSIRSFRKKTNQIIRQYTDPNAISHEYAIMNSVSGKFFGTQFTMNSWNPTVQVPTEFSLAQTWLVSGTGSGFNSIEAGWQVYQNKYRDANTRLFVFWTNNGYQPPLCYNLDCTVGFVQTSQTIIVGGTISPVSQYNGIQQELSILIWKDKTKGDWWLKVGKENVGYWPGSLFASLNNGATNVQWGGEVINEKTGGKHTTTGMGSGHFADEGYKKAGYFRNLETVDGNNIFTEAQGNPFVTNDKCYNVKAGNGGTPWGVNFYYGGPGQNKDCP